MGFTFLLFHTIPISCFSTFGMPSQSSILRLDSNVIIIYTLHTGLSNVQLLFAWPHIRNSYLISEIITPTDQQEKNL